MTELHVYLQYIAIGIPDPLYDVPIGDRDKNTAAVQNVVYDYVTTPLDTAKNVAYGHVTSHNMAYGHVTSPNMAYGHVTSPDVAYDDVTSPNVAYDDVTSPNVAYDDVTSPNVAYDHVTSYYKSK